jgi:chemotaxis protein MotB
MVAGGMDDAKTMRVVGLASTALFDKQQPYSPGNRRISIVVLNKRTEEAILADGRQTDVEAAPEIGAKVSGAPAAAAGK